MKRNLKILLVIPILVFGFAFLTRAAYGSWFEFGTSNIFRQTPPTPPAPPVKPEPPNPPTPPTKPEPSPPPTPSCGDPGCPTPTPQESPKPSESPSPTPSATEPPSEGGTGGAPFQFGGPPPPGEAGQVLGASTLGATGSAEENIFLMVFTVGATFLGMGVRKHASRAHRRA